MRSKAEVEIDSARSILEAMKASIADLESRWPASKRGSNAQRALNTIKEQRDAAALCVGDATAAIADAVPVAPFS